MPFQSLSDAQQIEITVAGPGDANRLYLCKGIAQGYFSVQAQAGQWQNANDTWQFNVGPDLDSTQFRRAIATVGFAGLQENEAGPSYMSWMIQTVVADFDDDGGKVRLSVTNAIQVGNQEPPGEPTIVAGVSALTYDVSILAAIAA